MQRNYLQRPLMMGVLVCVLLGLTSTASQTHATSQSQSQPVYSVMPIAFSHDGKRVVSGSLYFLNIFDAETGYLQGRIRGMGENAEIWSIAYSQDDQVIATGFYSAEPSENVIRLWDAGSGAKIASTRRRGYKLFGHRDAVLSIEFSKDGRQLVSASADHTVIVWDSKEFTHMHHFKGHTDIVKQAVFSPDGSMVASASLDQTVRLWSTKNGQLLHTLNQHKSPVIAVSFSNDKNYLASADINGTVMIWRIGGDDGLGSPKLLKQHLVSNRKTRYVGKIETLTFVDEDRKLVVGTHSQHVQIFDLAQFQLVEHHEQVLPQVTEITSLHQQDLRKFYRFPRYRFRFGQKDLNQGQTLVAHLPIAAEAQTLISQEDIARANKKCTQRAEGRFKDHYALLVGVSDYGIGGGDRFDLDGTQNDVAQIARTLVQLGYPPQNIYILGDEIITNKLKSPSNSQRRLEVDSCIQMGLPTKQSILERLTHFASMSEKKKMKHLFFFLAGHGTQLPDRPGTDGINYLDEPDGMDEAFLPRDVSTWTDTTAPGAIIDDEFRVLFSSITQHGTNIWSVFDHCHSETVTRGQKSIKSDTHTNRKLTPSDLGVPKEAIKEARRRATNTFSRAQSREKTAYEFGKPSPNQGLMMAMYGASSHQAAKENTGNDATGRLTDTLVTVLSRSTDTHVSYRQLCQEMEAFSIAKSRSAAICEGSLDQPIFDLGDVRKASYQWRIHATSVSLSDTTQSENTISPSLYEAYISKIHDLGIGSTFGVYPSAMSGADDKLGEVVITATDQRMISKMTLKHHKGNKNFPSGSWLRIETKIPARTLTVTPIIGVGNVDTKVVEQLNTVLQNLTDKLGLKISDTDASHSLEIHQNDSKGDIYLALVSGEHTEWPAAGSPEYWSYIETHMPSLKFSNRAVQAQTFPDAMGHRLEDALKKLKRKFLLLKQSSEDGEKASVSTDLKLILELKPWNSPQEVKEIQAGTGEVVALNQHRCDADPKDHTQTKCDLYNVIIRNTSKYRAYDVGVFYISSRLGISPIMPLNYVLPGGEVHETTTRVPPSKNIRLFHDFLFNNVSTLGKEYILAIAFPVGDNSLDTRKWDNYGQKPVELKLPRSDDGASDGASTRGGPTPMPLFQLISLDVRIDADDQYQPSP